MALSDFMPYGAPELLEGASPRMARSTFTATGLVAAIVCCIGIVVANRHVIQEPVIEVPPDVFNPDRFQVLQAAAERHATRGGALRAHRQLQARPRRRCPSSP
jgi:hypothetical protein